MADLKRITWLASYPKSGNTWLRIFLANYIVNPETPVSINQVNQFGFSDNYARDYFMAAGRRFDTKNLDAMAQVRGRVLERFARGKSDVTYVKTHNRNFVARGYPTIPNEFSRAAVYVVRNPLDMVLSYARHFNTSHERATESICNKHNAVLADGDTVGSYLGTWNDHVQSWTSNTPFPVEVIRYEDMLGAPEKTFSTVLTHLGVPVEEERLTNAVAFSSFKELKQQEDAGGFKERSKRASDQFFKTGSAGQWREELAPELVAKIRKVNRPGMQRFGYYNV